MIRVDDRVEAQLCPLSVATLSSFAKEVSARATEAQGAAISALGLPKKVVQDVRDTVATARANLLLGGNNQEEITEVTVAVKHVYLQL